MTDFKTFLAAGLSLFFAISVAFGAEDTAALKGEVISQVDHLAPLISEISSELWTWSELALKEVRSSEYLAAKLKQEGFSVEAGVADMPTAFVATFGSGKPVIGILAEFDALPGVGNGIVPSRQKRDDGVTSGQGCGHNLFGAASVGSAIALKKLMQEKALSGTIKLFGTPAEETLVGKVYMVKAGVFDGLDAALDWHPGTETEVTNDPGRAMNNFEVEFFGQAAHSSADPWNGRSALDAVELMNYGVNLMREHVMPSTRIHYVIPSGGEAPNVVPEYAKVWYYVRDINREEVEGYYSRILKIAEGAALGTGTTHKVQLITGVHEYLLNRPLQEALYENMKLVGPVSFDEEEQSFAKELQKFLNVEQKGYATEIKELGSELKPASGGSTDVAEVSFMAPTAGFSVTTAAEGIPWHSWATTACHGTQAVHKAAVVAAKILATTGVDILTRPDLVKKMRDAFEEATKDNPYQSPVPQDQKPILPN